MAKAERARPGVGLYEATITRRLNAALRQLDPKTHALAQRAIEAADADLVVAQHLVPLIRRSVAGLPSDARVSHAVELANELAQVLHRHAPNAVSDADEIAEVAQVLLSIAPTSTLPGHW